MLPKWTGEIVGTAHLYGIKVKELAAEAGMSVTAMSEYLNGHRRSDSAEGRIRAALMRLIEGKEPMREDNEYE